MTQKMRILIVEDELLVADDLQEMLSEMDYEVIGIAKTGEKAITLALEKKPDLILMDINLAGEMDGITAAGQIRNTMDVPIIFLTAFATEAMISRAKLTKPSGYILKPYSETQIRTSMEIALFNYSLERQIKERDATIQMLVDTAEDALMLLDPSGTVQYLNTSMGVITGKRPEEMIGLKIEDLRETGIISEPVFELSSSARMGIYGKIEARDGESWCEYTCIPVLDSEGKVTQIGFYCHDITLRKKIEIDLHTAVHNLLDEREILKATKEEIDQVNVQLRERLKTHSRELASVKQIMAKNRFVLSIINAGDTALKEGLDELSFFQRICTYLVSEGNYQESWIISTHPSGEPVHMVMSDQSRTSLSDFTQENGQLMFCPARGVQDITVINGGGEDCSSCPLKEKHDGRLIITAPIQSEEIPLGVVGVVLNQEQPLIEQNESALLGDICSNIGFALQYLRSYSRETTASKQISKNIEILSILNDEIRNPLTIIAVLSEMEGGGYTDRIIEQVNRIDKVIEKLDAGSLESMKIFDYLKKHHGLEEDNCPPIH